MNYFPRLTRRAFAAGFVTSCLISGGRAQPATPRLFTRGARVPPGLADRVRAQNAMAKAIDEKLLTDSDFLKSAGEAYPLSKNVPTTLPPQFLGQASPVKDQKSCGSCWVFAATSAYEAAYLRANKQLINVSEQEALDCTFADQNCIVGGWHETVFLYLELLGLIGGDVYPYQEAKQICTSNMPRQFFALNWGYIRDKDMPDNFFLASDVALKNAISQYGPVVSAVLTSSPDPKYRGWDSYFKRYENGEANPDWLTEFPNGVFSGIPSASLKPDQIDHEVLIVGWDDKLGDHGCWIIKNSWGTNWGDEGYIRLPYQTSNIGFGASWITAVPNTVVPASLAKALKDIHESSDLLSRFPSLSELH